MMFVESEEEKKKIARNKIGMRTAAGVILQDFDFS